MADRNSPQKPFDPYKVACEVLEEMIEEEDSQVCIFYEASRRGRTTENSRGQGNRGTECYEKAGCYDCDGRNEACDKYLRPYGEDRE